MSLIPMIVDKEIGGERSYDIFSRLLKNRIILLSGEIDDNLSNIIVSELLYLDSINHEDINIYINSPGGSITAGMAIYDTMNYIKSKVDVYKRRILFEKKNLQKSRIDKASDSM